MGGRRLSLALALAVAAVLSGALGAAASAQDTELTPEPKPVGSEGPAFQWAVMAGAKFNRGGDMFEHSPTPYTVDFFSTAFAPPGDDGVVSGTGFFAGAQCREDVPFDRIDDCKREPAIYQLAEDERGDQRITRVLNPDNDTDPGGFVAAVAWIDSETALAIGGDGAYPRREPATPVDDPGYVDPAGDARAWLYEDGSWRELQDLPDPPAGFTGEGGDEIPDGMAGMTALACRDPDPKKGDPALSGRCLAGGLRRLWWWRPGSGGEPGGYDPKPVTPADVLNAAGQPDFYFRVRAIRFAPFDPGVNIGDVPSVLAATSGCCVARGGPPTGARVLSYYRIKKSWQSDKLKPTGDPFNPIRTQDVSPNQAASEAVGGAGSQVLGDSYYGLIYSERGDSAAIASPGGEPTPGEPGSRIILLKGSASPLRLWSGELGASLTSRGLDSVRLLSADGDFNGPPTPGNEIAGQTGSDFVGGPDGLPDWSVGRLKESALGVAYTTVPALVPVPNPLSCTVGFLGTGLLAGCEPVPENLEASTESRRLVGMGTYALNAISFVPGTGGRTAWAAGDRGALARLGGGGSVGSQSEPEAPFIRPRGESALAEREPFEPFRPSSAAEPGAVPPLAAQPLEKLAEPALVPYGTDDPMSPTREGPSAFAMSRDGSEGWAIGKTAHHFDGERWVRCDQGALPPPDEACASLLVASEGVTLSTIVRVPLERDDDPTNDDEFAAIALGNVGSKARVLNYREGSWEPDPQAAKELGDAVRDVSVVFRAPDDGWLTGKNPQDPGVLGGIFHYGGDEWPNGHWKPCTIAACGAGFSVVPGASQLQLAGDTLYVAGARSVAGSGGAVTYPFVAAKELDSNAPWRMEYDPGCPESKDHPPDSQTPPGCSGSLEGSSQQGTVGSFSIVERGDGEITGWLMGRFGPSLPGFSTVDTADGTREARKLVGSSSGNLIRRDPDSGEWSLRTVEDAASAYLPGFGGSSKVMSFRGSDGEERSIIVGGGHPWLSYDPGRDRWEVSPAPFVSNHPKFLGNHTGATQGAPGASGPDGQGGFWVAVRQSIGNTVNVPDEPVNQLPTYFYHYTDRAPKPVFEDAPHPIREPISGLDGSADGTVWVSTYSGRLYRYDRIGGWEGARIPGWDPGRAVTNPSRAFAVAVNDSGVGVAVGEEGRIGDISPDSVRLDAASGRRCSELPPPCGTPQALRAAAVAPDGSALVGGENLTLMWRAAGGDFDLVDGPPISVGATITAISMPASSQAWLTTADGQIWRGTLVGSNWDWERESAASAAADERGWSRLNDIAVDAAGRGLAVGSRGSMLERQPDGTWRRLATGYLDSLYSVALPPAGYGDGTLVGGSVGVVLTRVDGAFHLVRRSDIFDPVTGGHGATAAARIVGVAVAGGASDGEVEAWAASQIPESWSRRAEPTAALLHYTNSDDPLLHPDSRAGALPDAPEMAPNELTFAAFGRSECQVDVRPRFCPEFQGTNMFSEVVTRRIQDEIGARAAEAEGGLAALFSGDINSAPGRERGLFTPLDANVTHNAWRQLVAESLLEEGIPLFGALGKADLSGTSECVTSPCLAARDFTDAGLSLQWRQALAEMPSPWGHGDDADAQGLEFEPVDEASLAGVEALEGEARTHYAADIVREGEAIARLVAVDNSLGSLAESTVNQNPVEEQQTWLENALCFRGSAADTGLCTRERGQEAIVLANYPTYTYATNISPTDTATDGALFESTLLRYDVDVLITGRLGWNGLYYACAPGLHYPAPGQGYPERTPRGLAECAAAAGGADAPGQLSDLASQATGAVSGTPVGALPIVVASGAGGRFGPRGDSDGSASEGFWRGYSVVRLNPENGEVVVEQRPVVDWVGLTTPELSLEPRDRVELHGFAREPAAIDVPLRYIEIDSPAVTHRYDLLLADPDEPWVPCEAADEACRSLHERLGGSRSSDSAAASGSGSAQDDSEGTCEPYLCLPENVATIDDQTGEVRAGNGKYPDTFAVAMLSMGDRSATQPLVFRKSPSFIANAIRITPGPPIQTAGAASSPSTAPPPPVPKPSIPQPNLPELPALPGIPPLSAAQPPEPQPPAPPAPPPPTEQPSPLDLTVSPTALTVATPAAVIQPPTPPVNPAPPSGARREARQRQAAAQKSGADSEMSEGAENARDAGGDFVQGLHGPEGAEMRRRDRTRPEPSFTPLARADQPSAWTRGALYGGSLTLMALALSLAWTGSRPTPRRRSPEVPAPAWQHTSRRYR